MKNYTNINSVNFYIENEKSINESSNNNISKEDFHSDFSLVSSNISGISLNNHKSDNQENFGLWDKLVINFSDLKNKIKFNILQIDNLVNFEELQNVQLFNKKYNINKDIDFLIKSVYFEIIWMSYRNNIEPIIYNNSLYTSDAGWGCMIRAGQMIFAKGLKEIEDQNKLSEIIILFSDNNLKIKSIIQNEYFYFFLKSKCKNQDNLFKSHEDYECVNNNSNTNSQKENLNANITPPFSIRNILNSSIRLNKGAGDWFSDQDIIKILIELNNKYNPIKILKILHFSDGVIYLNEIIQKCFKIKKCNCNSRISFEYDKLQYKFKEIEDDYLIIDNFIPDPDECKCYNTSFYFKEKYYELINPFLIFISMRLGLNKLEENYYDSILDFFKIHNNIGLIGGKGSRALYFVGHSERNLIFLDPHFVQESVNFNNLENDFISTYLPSNYYSIEIEKMTPSITFGFQIKNINDFLLWLNDLRNIKNKLIKISENRK